MLTGTYKDGNKKSVHLSLTAKAKPVVTYGKKEQSDFAAVLFDGFTDDEIAAFERYHIKILDNINRKKERQIMQYLITTAVCLLAGLGAGLGTGFAGMSAAAVITPMLVTFLGIEPYTAVGIALASDVLASAVSAYTYGKNKNLDIKNGLVMMITVLIFTVVGSFVSSLVPSVTMGNFSVFMTLLLGIKFIVRPVMTTKPI